MKIGILGSGDVAKMLGLGLLAEGHDVMLGTRSSEKLRDWQSLNPRGQIGSFSEAAAFGEVLILSVHGTAAAAALTSAGPNNLESKVILDTTNPIADAAPVNGVLRFFTDLNHSLMEALQLEFPKARFVKAFNSVGAGAMVHPVYKEGPPSMFICGNDDDAKQVAAKLISSLGWTVEDMGKVEAARAIEPLCMLWCILGFGKGEWNHAFKLLHK